MNSQLITAILMRSDERGFCRTTYDELAADTGMSRSTVKRLIQQFVDAGVLQRRVKDGRSGGLLLRLETGPQTGSQTGSETGSKPVQTGSAHNAFPCGAGPSGPSPALGSQTGSTGSRQTPAHRPAAAHETPASGADLVYTGPEGEGRWIRQSATLWLAPNGDLVSIRSMTPELRMRLRVDLNDDGTECLEAVRAIRGILDR